MTTRKMTTELYVWGSDCMGQLGLNSKLTKDKAENQLTTPKSCSFNIQIASVACGEDFTFLLTTQGLLYGMGSNQHGKLGLTEPQYSTPKLVDSLQPHKIKQIACGLNHALAVTRDTGVVFSWGWGQQGQLGRPQTKGPAAIMSFVQDGIKIKELAAGGKHSLFLSESGAVYSSGCNDYGQLGYQTKTSEEPKVVLVVKCVQVVCGLVHSQVLSSGGQVYSFGDNQFGQLGIGAQPKQTWQPKKVDISGIRKISCNHHTAAINELGALFFWGTGVFGTFNEPKMIIDADIVDVSVGGSFGIATDKDGLLWSWGQNSSGELGQSDKITKQYPHPIISLKRKQIRHVFCGGSFVIAMGPDKLIEQKKGSKSIERRKSSKENEVQPKPLSSERLPKVQSADMVDILSSDAKSPSYQKIFNISVPNTVHSPVARAKSRPKRIKKSQLTDGTLKSKQASKREILEQLQQSMLANQELQYLVSSREMKINMLIQELSQFTDVVRFKDDEQSKLCQMFDQTSKDNILLQQQNQQLKQQNQEIQQQLLEAHRELYILKQLKFSESACFKDMTSKRDVGTKTSMEQLAKEVVIEKKRQKKSKQSRKSVKSCKSARSRRSSSIGTQTRLRSMSSEIVYKSSQNRRRSMSSEKVNKLCMQQKREKIFDLRVSNERQPTVKSEAEFSIDRIDKPRKYSISNLKQNLSSPQLKLGNQTGVSFSQTRSFNKQDSPQKTLQPATQSVKSPDKSPVTKSKIQQSPVRSETQRQRLARASQLLKSQQAPSNIYKRSKQDNQSETIQSQAEKVSPLPRESIDNFKRKLCRLEQNKNALEDKVKKFEREIRSRSPTSDYL